MTTTQLNEHTAPTSPAPIRACKLRRGLLAFAVSEVVITLGITLIARSQGADIRHLDDLSVLGQVCLFGAAFVPTASMLFAWLASGIGPAWGFRRLGVMRVLLVAWAIPVIASLFAYLPAWLSNIADFDAANLEKNFGGMPAPLAVIVGLGPGLIPWIALAVGEQVGWSSWLVVRMSELFGRTAVAVTYGVGWCLAHVPLMLLIPGAVPDGVPTWYAVPMFLVQTTAMAFPMVWMRLDGRTIWPVLVLHAAMNASIYFVGDLLTVDRSSTEWFVGEGALLTSAGIAVATLLTAPVWRKAR